VWNRTTQNLQSSKSSLFNLHLYDTSEWPGSVENVTVAVLLSTSASTLTASIAQTVTKQELL